MDLGTRLQTVIDHFDLSIKSFAKEVGTSDGTIRGIIKGRVGSIDGNILIKIQKKYNVNAVWLLTGEGEMFLGPPAATSTSPPKESVPPAEINGLGVIEGNVETYPQVDIIEKISRTGWWRKLSSVKKNIVAAVDEIEDQEYLATVDKGLRGKVESDRFQKAIEEAVDKHVPGVRQKGEAG